MITIFLNVLLNIQCRRRRLISWKDKHEDQLNLFMTQEQKNERREEHVVHNHKMGGGMFIKLDESFSGNILLEEVHSKYQWRKGQDSHQPKMRVINLIYSNIYFVQNTKNNNLSMVQFLMEKKNN